MPGRQERTGLALEKVSGTCSSDQSTKFLKHREKNPFTGEKSKAQKNSRRQFRENSSEASAVAGEETEMFWVSRASGEAKASGLSEEQVLNVKWNRVSSPCMLSPHLGLDLVSEVWAEVQSLEECFGEVAL